MNSEKKLLFLGKKHYKIQRKIRREGLEGCDVSDLRKQQIEQIKQVSQILSSDPDISPGVMERVKRLFRGK